MSLLITNRARRDVEMYEEDDALRAAKEERDMAGITTRLDAILLDDEGKKRGAARGSATYPPAYPHLSFAQFGLAAFVPLPANRVRRDVEMHEHDDRTREAKERRDEEDISSRLAKIVLDDATQAERELALALELKRLRRTLARARASENKERRARARAADGGLTSSPAGQVLKEALRGGARARRGRTALVPSMRPASLAGRVTKGYAFVARAAPHAPSAYQS